MNLSVMFVLVDPTKAMNHATAYSWCASLVRITQYSAFSIRVLGRISLHDLQFLCISAMIDR